jgi:hypothetical protein
MQALRHQISGRQLRSGKLFKLREMRLHPTVKFFHLFVLMIVKKLMAPGSRFPQKRKTNEVPAGIPSRLAVGKVPKVLFLYIDKFSVQFPDSFLSVFQQFSAPLTESDSSFISLQRLLQRQFPLTHLLRNFFELSNGLLIRKRRNIL